MTIYNKQDLEEQDIVEDMEQEIEDIETIEGEIDEDRVEEAQKGIDIEEEKLKDVLARTVADFDNFKKRTARDRDEMIFFLKSDILKKVLPRVDDLDRIVANTPEDMRVGALYEGVISMQTKLVKDLDAMGVKPFESKGNEVDPDKHDVMTTVPGQKEGIIFDEFEKGYMLGDKVLRHAKVVVGAGE